MVGIVLPKIPVPSTYLTHGFCVKKQVCRSKAKPRKHCLAIHKHPHRSGWLRFPVLDSVIALICCPFSADTRCILHRHENSRMNMISLRKQFFFPTGEPVPDLSRLVSSSLPSPSLSSLLFSFPRLYYEFRVRVYVAFCFCPVSPSLSLPLSSLSPLSRPFFSEFFLSFFHLGVRVYCDRAWTSRGGGVLICLPALVG